MKLRSDEITALLRQHSTIGGAEGGPVSSCDVAFALFLEPHPVDAPPLSRIETVTERLIQACSAEPALVHVELLVPPVPDSGGNKVHFGTYLSPPFKAGWQGLSDRDRDNNIEYYLVSNGSRWRALPVFISHAVDAVREAADRNVDAPYSVMRYATSARPLRRLSWLLSDADKAPGHCATLTARVLRHAGATDAVPRSSAWYSPSTLYSTLLEHAGTRLAGKDREQMGTVASAESTHTAGVLIRGPLSYDTVRSVGDARAIDAVRALTLRVCNAASAQDAVASRNAQKDLAQVLLRWVLLRDEASSGS